MGKVLHFFQHFFNSEGPLAEKVRKLEGQKNFWHKSLLQEVFQSKK